VYFIAKKENRPDPSEWIDAVDAASTPSLPTPLPPTPSPDHSDGLSSGKIAGIVCGCIGGLLLIALLIYWFCAKNSTGPGGPTTPPVGNSSPQPADL